MCVIGDTIDDKLKFDDHVNQIGKKVSKYIGIIYK